ncbi:unnamed protein product [Linum trigynum]|uniref:Uncharacterized protein n=1 Tax=Linum trigynum TaxID=586398 RepID=A0AAV2E945_9ROSI
MCNQTWCCGRFLGKHQPPEAFIQMFDQPRNLNNESKSSSSTSLVLLEYRGLGLSTYGSLSTSDACVDACFGALLLSYSSPYTGHS